MYNWKGKLPLSQVFREAFIRFILSSASVKSWITLHNWSGACLCALQIHIIISDLKEDSKKVDKGHIVSISNTILSTQQGMYQARNGNAHFGISSSVRHHKPDSQPEQSACLYSHRHQQWRTRKLRRGRTIIDHPDILFLCWTFKRISPEDFKALSTMEG